MKSEKHQGAAAETLQRMVAPEARELRKQAGDWLKLRRADAGRSQVDLAARPGLKYYTFISQIEDGLSRIPTEAVAAWAPVVRTVLVGCTVRHDSRRDRASARRERNPRPSGATACSLRLIASQI
jgi:hypothetical protein